MPPPLLESEVRDTGRSPACPEKETTMVLHVYTLEALAHERHTADRRGPAVTGTTPGRFACPIPAGLPLSAHRATRTGWAV